MKSILSWIRWKYVVPLCIFVAALLVFFILFFDPLLARALEKIGSKANGAKVEVSGLRTKLLAGRLSIRRFQVANPAEPMSNRVEGGPFAFQLSFPDLIARRVIINEATLKGLAFNTPRKTSGALPKPIIEKKAANKAPSAASRLAEKYQDQFKLNIDGIKGDVKAKIDFDPKNLGMVHAADSLKEKAQTLPAQWDRKVQDLNVDTRLKKAEDDLKSIRETPTSGTEALTAIPASLKKLKQVKDDLEYLKKEVQSAEEAASNDTKALKAGASDLTQAKKKDVDDLMSRLNLDFANPDRLAQGIVGPMVLERFKTIFHYVELARQHMPSKQEKETPPARPRAKGMDIEFPTPAAPPRFCLVKADLEGSYESVQASGFMSNLTSDPARVGKPFKLDLHGQQGLQKFGAQATLDHTGDINKDSLVFQTSGFDVKKLVPEGIDGPGFSEGMGSAEAVVSLIGEENIGGQISLVLTGLKFDDAVLLQKVGLPPASQQAGVENTAASGGDKLKADFMRNVARAIEGMKQVTISAQIFGTWKEPGLKIASNLSSVLSNVIKDSVGNAVKDQRQQLEARLNGILTEKQKEVGAVTSGLEGKASGQFGAIESKIRQKINEATGINLSSGSPASPLSDVKTPSLKGLFKR